MEDDVAKSLSTLYVAHVHFFDSAQIFKVD